MVGLALLLLFAPQGQLQTKVKTVTTNGATIWVERVEGAKTFSLQVWASARAVPPTPETYGWRHLLEHFLAKGKDGQLGGRLELKGAFLRAETLRDAMHFRIDGPPSAVPDALIAIQTLFDPISPTQAQITAETKLIGQEITLQSSEDLLAQAAWRAGFGDEGQDPMGSLEQMATATPEALEELRERQLTPRALAIVFAGNFDPQEMSNKIRQIVKGASLNLPAFGRRQMAKPSRAESDGFGELRAAPVESFDQPATAAALAGAFALASKFPAAFVTYTPSITSGLAMVGKNDTNSGIGLLADSLTKDQETTLFPIGKALALSWVSQYLTRPSGIAYIRGLTLCLDREVRPETLLENVRNLTFAQFQAGIEGFRSENGIVVVGQ